MKHFPFYRYICLSPFKYLYIFWVDFSQNALLGYIVANAQEICLGSPDLFSLWEGGVWGVCPLTTKFCYVSTINDVCEIMYQALPTFQHCKVTDWNGREGGRLMEVSGSKHFGQSQLRAHLHTYQWFALPPMLGNRRGIDMSEWNKPPHLGA